METNIDIVGVQYCSKQYWEDGNGSWETNRCCSHNNFTLINLFVVSDWAPLPSDMTCLLTFLSLPISLHYKLIVKPLSTDISLKTTHPMSHMIISSANKYSRKISCCFRTNWHHPLLVHFSLPKSI